MTFLDAKAELNDLLNLRREIMLLEAIQADMRDQSLKSPRLDSIGFSKKLSTDEQLITKTDKLNKLDDQMANLKKEESFYLTRLQAIDGKSAATLMAVYYLGYKLGKVATLGHYSKSEMSRRLSKATHKYADTFQRPLKIKSDS